MTNFASSYLGRLRSVVGDRLLLVRGMRILVERQDGAILLQLRSDYRLWGLPSGVPDEGESADETVIRGTFEETGIRVCDPVPFGFACDPEHEVWTYPDDDRCHYFTLPFAARFSPEVLPPLLPVMRRTLDAYARYRTTEAFR